MPTLQANPPPLESIPDDERFKFRPPLPKNKNKTTHSGSKYNVEGNCCYCYLPIQFGVNEDSFECQHCSKINIGVVGISAQADCSRCGKMQIRRDGDNALKCEGCSHTSLEAVCSHCGSRFVYAAHMRHQLPDGMLPCSTCPNKTPIEEGTVKAEIVQRRMTLPEKPFYRQDFDLNAEAILIVQPYVDSNDARFKEICDCLQFNLNNKHFQSIFLLSESNSDLQVFQNKFQKFVDDKKLILIDHNRRLTFADAIAFVNDNKSINDNTIIILANADVFFDDSLSELVDDTLSNTVFALSRFDRIVSKNQVSYRFNHFVAPLSQDAWIYRKGCVPSLEFVTVAREERARLADEMLTAYEKAPLQTESVSSVPLRNRVPNRKTLLSASSGRYAFGLPGADNRLVYELGRDDIVVRNACFRIIVHHLHTTNVRHYDAEKDKVGPPYNVANPEPF